ncbi:MAG TPA: TonB-dependent receptor [Candidatus Limnocylindrales bacterium]|nr:TonB-dependent receptor [Candidatus Limnocylindrales bacterium]
MGIELPFLRELFLLRLASRRSIAASCLILSPLALVFAAVPAFAQGARIDGTVRDSSGAAVAGAKVALHAGSYSANTVTAPSGSFSFEGVPATSGTISVTAAGFQVVQRAWSAGTAPEVTLDVTLVPGSFAQTIVVTAARAATPESESPSITDLTGQDIQATPTLMLDDTLRQVPGFSTFRRASSRTANPTTEGVSLRGLGASGASRALVLEDGIPLNDPFGGWVYWDRIPEQSISSIEISEEGGSSLYGSNALGGVVQFLTRSPEQAGISLETSYGNQNTPDLSLWAGGTAGRWESSFAGEVFHTDGYILVPEADRGSIDTKAGVEDGSADLMIGRKIGAASEVFARGWFLNESRANGTPDQINNTRLAQGALGANLQLGAAGSLTLRFYGDSQTYNQTFSSVAADRNSESLTDVQAVPSQGVGGSAVWSRGLGKRQTLVAGFDAHEEIGHSHEFLVAAGRDTSAGGSQRTIGFFGEDLIQITPRWTLSASARFDDWRNFDASLISIPIAAPTTGTTTVYPNQSYNVFNPRLSVVNRVTSHVSWSASIYRAFRAPTLNELYRSFRQGNTLTQSNANLVAERLTGGEAGVTVDTWNHRLQVRSTVFLNEIIDPIANVTLTTTPTLITRQRQNLGRTRAPGVEVDATAQLASCFELVAGYQFVDAEVTQYPVNPALVGLWVAQVPHHVVTFQARYQNPSRINFSVDGRMVGLQYDDDQNQFPLGRFFVLDAMASRGIGRGIELFVAGENLFNAQYETAATPVPQLGLPITVRAGLRFDFPRR